MTKEKFSFLFIWFKTTPATTTTTMGNHMFGSYLPQFGYPWGIILFNTPISLEGIDVVAIIIVMWIIFKRGVQSDDLLLVGLPSSFRWLVPKALARIMYRKGTEIVWKSGSLPVLDYFVVSMSHCLLWSPEVYCTTAVVRAIQNWKKLPTTNFHDTNNTSEVLINHFFLVNIPAYSSSFHWISFTGKGFIEG